MQFEHLFLDKNLNEHEFGFKQSYEDLFISDSQKDLKTTMTKIIDVCDFIYSRYAIAKENDHGFRDRELILSRKDENGKNIIFIYFLYYFQTLRICILIIRWSLTRIVSMQLMMIQKRS